MFAADARKHTPGKNAEKENFSMGMFKNTLLLAQQGNEKAMEKLLNRYDPLLKKCSIIQGHFDEDLYQSLILEFVRAVSAFKI